MKNNKKICGIIAEYNPFHNGHKYQLDIVKKDYDAVIVVMSGSFTQRGDVAIIDKWSRAKCALAAGADLVLELPTVFALNTAERFAFGGINLLSKLGCVNAVSFGSECGNIKVLTEAATALINETPEQSKNLRTLMKSGMSYASAREKVFSDIPENILDKPNNILAIEYIKHITKNKSNMLPITHKRAGSDYNDTELNSNFASASAIRANINNAEILLHMPEDAYKIFKAADKHSLSQLNSAALFHIRTNGSECLKNCLECVEGLENRIYEAACNLSSINDIADACSTKRYTKAKIRRIILSSMLKIEDTLSYEMPAYARVLGATKSGREILSEIKDNCALQIITKAADYKNYNEMFKKDILATDVWALGANTNNLSGLDYTTSPIMI